MTTLAAFTLTGKQVKDYFGMIKEISDECRLHITKDKLRVFIVDRANVAMILSELTVDTDANELLQIGVDIQRILAFTRIAKDTDPIDFEIVKTKEEPCLHIRCMDHSAKIKTLGTLGIRKDPSKQPEVTLTHTFPISGERVSEFFKLYSKRNGVFEIVVKDNKCLFKTHNENGFLFQTIISNAPAGKARGLYSSDYLRSVFLRMKKSMITVSMAVDYPVKLVTDGNDIHIEVMVAPRIKAD